GETWAGRGDALSPREQAARGAGLSKKQKDTRMARSASKADRARPRHRCPSCHQGARLLYAPPRANQISAPPKVLGWLAPVVLVRGLLPRAKCESKSWALPAAATIGKSKISPAPRGGGG